MRIKKSIKKRNVIACFSAVLIALSVVFVPNALALTVQTGTSTQPYYIVVGAREYDFVKVYVDNATNTVMWVFDKEEILSLALFNDYNAVASGMFGSLQNQNMNATDTSVSFLIGAFIDTNYLPTGNNFDFSSYMTWSQYLYYDGQLQFRNPSDLAYANLSHSYAYTSLPHMSKGNQYFDEAVEAGHYAPCLIFHLSQSYSIDYFSDYACIGAGIQLLEITQNEYYEQGYQTGFGAGYNNGYNTGVTEGEANKETEKETEYNRGKVDGEREYIENVLPVERENAYDEGYANGEINYIQNFLPTKENIAYQNGYREGKLQVGNNSFYDLLTAVFDVPVETITGLLDFNLMGTNMKGLFLSFLSLAVIICIARWLI